MPAKYLGAADEIKVVGDEAGFELHFSTDDGTYIVNVHRVAEDLHWSVDNTIGAWLAEGREAWSTRPIRDDPDAYDRSDPKHPDWHSVHADYWDTHHDAMGDK